MIYYWLYYLINLLIKTFFLLDTSYFSVQHLAPVIEAVSDASNDDESFVEGTYFPFVLIYEDVITLVSILMFTHSKNFRYSSGPECAALSVLIVDFITSDLKNLNPNYNPNPNPNYDPNLILTLAITLTLMKKYCCAQGPLFLRSTTFSSTEIR